MRNILIPSGSALFPGDLEALLHTIIRIDGVLMDNRQFRCTLTWPERKPVAVGVTGRGRLHFQFRCRFEAAETGFLIFYRVYPDFLGMLLLVLPFLAAYTGFAQFAEQGSGYFGLLIGIVFATVFYPMFLGIRKGCIRQFLQYWSIRV